MITKILAATLLAILISSCSSLRYLPDVAEIDACQYGSYIRITPKSGIGIKGELLAIDSSKVIVLAGSEGNRSQKAVVINTDQIYSFNLRYANKKHYGWTIPLFAVATISHGFIAGFTLPVNLIVTVAASATGVDAFQYKEKDITYDQLRMFARFPQGIPSHIDLASITRH